MGAGASVYLPDRAARRPVPFYETYVPAGFPSPAADYVEGRIDLTELLIKRPAATFLVRIVGDSMVGAGVFDGDLAIVDRALAATPGRIVVAVLDGELTVKRLRRGPDGRLVLAPENPAYPAIEVGEERAFEVWGCVTAVIHFTV